MEWFLKGERAVTEDTGVPFHQLQAEQIQMFRDAWTAAGHEREPRVSVRRSIFPIVNETDRAYFGGDQRRQDRVGFIDGGTARFGKTYAGEPDQLVRDLAEDGDRGRGHPAADDPERARRRLQRAPAGQYRPVRRA